MLMSTNTIVFITVVKCLQYKLTTVYRRSCKNSIYNMVQ